MPGFPTDDELRLGCSKRLVSSSEAGSQAYLLSSLAGKSALH
jgi:hypothetical protein